MPHFFVPPENIINGRFVLNASESAHLARVLRKKPGDEVRLFDGADHSYRGVLEVVTPKRVSGRIVEDLPRFSAPYFLRLFQGIPKGDTFEWIIEKATELGVSEIVPLQTQRSVSRLPADRWPDRRKRWEKIMAAAASQCGRADLPVLGNPSTFEQALSTGNAGPVLIPWEGEENVSVKAALKKMGSGSVSVLVGPEGGFDPQEVERAVKAGAQTVSLGPRILRTETAGLFVAAAVLYEYGL